MFIKIKYRFILAALVFSTSAFAQSNVTIGGYITNGYVAPSVLNSVGEKAGVANMALLSSDLSLNGAHSNPLSRRVTSGQNTFWIAGDAGRDDHAERSGSLGLAEMGIGKNFGFMQVNASLGQAWGRQDQQAGGRNKTDGSFVLLEALIPLKDNLWVTVGGYGLQGSADMRRSFVVTGVPVTSSGKADMSGWGARLRLDWDGLIHFREGRITPYLDATYQMIQMDSHTENGADSIRFDSRSERLSVLRAGLNATWKIANGIRLLGVVEGARRFEGHEKRVSGEIESGLGSPVAFSIEGQKYKQTWLRTGLGLEGDAAGGIASLWINFTSRAEVPSAWLAANWRMAF